MECFGCRFEAISFINKLIFNFSIYFEKVVLRANIFYGRCSISVLPPNPSLVFDSVGLFWDNCFQNQLTFDFLHPEVVSRTLIYSQFETARREGGVESMFDWRFIVEFSLQVLPILYISYSSYVAYSAHIYEKTP
jgi:hypothetical protein